MSLEKLKMMEEHFFESYPKGFEDEALATLVKGYNVAKLATFT